MSPPVKLSPPTSEDFPDAGFPVSATEGAASDGCPAEIKKSARLGADAEMGGRLLIGKVPSAKSLWAYQVKDGLMRWGDFFGSSSCTSDNFSLHT